MPKDDFEKSIHDFAPKIVHLICTELYDHIDLLAQFDDELARKLRGDLIKLVDRYS